MLEKDELTNREVLKLSKLMEKESGKGREEELKEPLNISGTTFSVAEDAVKNDSLYWNKVRPVPLTPEESLTLKERDSIISISKPVSGSDSVKVKGRGKKTLTNIATGTSKTFSKGKGRFTYGGLLDIERLNFNTVDGLSYGQEFRFQYKIDSLHTFRTSLIGGYAFSRKAPLLVFKSDFLYAPMRRGLLSLTLDYRSSDFNATSGMGKFANLEYSLVFRQNYMKLYEKINASLFNSIDLANGLALETKVDIGRQKSLANTTDYSFFYRNKRDYTPNLPDTAMQADDPYLIDRNRLAFDIKLKYTPRNFYVLRSGRKHMRGSDWPSFILNYQQTIPVDNQVWSKYSFVSGTVLYDSDIGLLSNLKGRFSGGYFINKSAMHFSDFNHFKSFPLLYDLIGLTNAYTLLDYYTSSSNDYWVEAHLTLTTAYLLIKYLPWFSERLWNESLSFSYLKTPSINHYTQLGYSLNEVFFLMDLGVYVAFEELKYSGVGFKLNFRF